MKKIWITGERGLLGQNLKTLIDKASKTLSVIPAPAVWGRRVSHHHNEQEVDIMAGNFSYRMEKLLDPKPDYIMHFAAVVGTDKCEAHPQECIDVNFEGTRRVLEVCQKIGAKLLYISTTATYDPAAEIPRPYTEASPQNPRTIYGISKYAGELLVRNQTKVPWVVLRPCFLVGNPPLDHSSQLCRVIMHSVIKHVLPGKAGPTPQVLMNPENLKDYMPVYDFVNALKMLFEHWNDNTDVEGQVFNISAMQAKPVEWYFKTAERLGNINVPMDYCWVPGADYLGEHTVDSTKLRKAVGWKPVMKIENQIGTMWATALESVLEAKRLNGELFYE